MSDNKLSDNKLFDNKIYFYYERMEPFGYPEPHDLRVKLSRHMIWKYRKEPLSKIPLSTEVVVKQIRDRCILKYKVVNCDWEITREIKDTLFTDNMFKFIKEEADEA